LPISTYSLYDVDGVLTPTLLATGSIPPNTSAGLTNQFNDVAMTPTGAKTAFTGWGGYVILDRTGAVTASATYSNQTWMNEALGVDWVELTEAQTFILADRSSGQSIWSDAVVIPTMAPGITYCFGNGAGSPCPCANSGGAYEGCGNSAGAGAVLGAIGSSSVTTADLALVGTQLPADKPALFFQGVTALLDGTALPLGDGLRCVGGGVIRLSITTSDGMGTALMPAGTSIPMLGAVTAGMIRRYQLWYRDPEGPCGTGSNLTNALEVRWTP